MDYQRIAHTDEEEELAIAAAKTYWNGDDHWNRTGDLIKDAWIRTVRVVRAARYWTPRTNKLTPARYQECASCAKQWPIPAPVIRCTCGARIQIASDLPLHGAICVDDDCPWPEHEGECPVPTLEMWRTEAQRCRAMIGRLITESKRKDETIADYRKLVSSTCLSVGEAIAVDDIHTKTNAPVDRPE